MATEAEGRETMWEKEENVSFSSSSAPHSPGFLLPSSCSSDCSSAEHWETGHQNNQSSVNDCCLLKLLKMISDKLYGHVIIILLTNNMTDSWAPLVMVWQVYRWESYHGYASRCSCTAKTRWQHSIVLLTLQSQWSHRGLCWCRPTQCQ